MGQTSTFCRFCKITIPDFEGSTQHCPEYHPLAESGEGGDELVEHPAGHVDTQGDPHGEDDDTLIGPINKCGHSL